MPDFSKARKGDRVFSILSGWGEIADTKGAVYPLQVKFDVGSSNYYTMDGRLDRDDIRADLYWDEVTLNIPESATTPPKRKVKRFAVLRIDKTITGKGPLSKVEIAEWGQFALFNSNTEAIEYMDGAPFMCKGPFEIEIKE